MIARTWTGATATDDADEYEDYTLRVAVPRYAEVAGNRLVVMLRRDREDRRTDFATFTLWENLDAIRAFAGPDAERAVFHPDDDRFLVERACVARHHMVYGLRRSILGWSRAHQLHDATRSAADMLLAERRRRSSAERPAAGR